MNVCVIPPPSPIPQSAENRYDQTGRGGGAENRDQACLLVHINIEYVDINLMILLYTFVWPGGTGKPAGKETIYA